MDKDPLLPSGGVPDRLEKRTTLTPGGGVGEMHMIGRAANLLLYRVGEGVGIDFHHSIGHIEN